MGKPGLESIGTSDGKPADPLNRDRRTTSPRVRGDAGADTHCRHRDQPVLRAVQTADIVGRRHAAPVHPGTERSAGDRINRYWKDLADDPAKRDWYLHPTGPDPSGGETLCEVQQRAVAAVEQALLVAQDGPYVCRVPWRRHSGVASPLSPSRPGTLRQAPTTTCRRSGIEVTGSAAHLLFLNHRPGLEAGLV